MRLPRFRVRTLMVVVGVVALLLWGGMMGSRSYRYVELARQYEFQEFHWRENAMRDRGWAKFGLECADYFAMMSRKYRRAAWHPWLAVEPDPLAPGVAEAIRARQSPPTN